MKLNAIFTTLLGAAVFLKKPIEDTVSQTLKDSYTATKEYLRKRFVGNTDATRALDLATAKPESLIRKALLIEESATADLESDDALARLITNLASLLPSSVKHEKQNLRVTGHGNTVQVAGRDLIHTSRLIQRNVITPDERHLSNEQRDHIRQLVGELAERLADDSGTANFGAVYRMLQRRFQVLSYLLIPSEKYEEAMSFLRQQRAINRSRLRHRNPVAYQKDLYRTIFAGASELGWTGEQVYVFAAQKFGLKTTGASLKISNLVQLKALANSIQQQVRKHREGDSDASASSAT